jgi:hypothetical protein
MTITMRRLWLVLSAALVCSALPARAQTVCTGDCNEDGFVLVDELLIGVGIALESGSPETCMAADADGSGQVEINELVEAVGNLVVGCAGVSTRTPTITGQPTPTPTSTPITSPTVPDAARFAGATTAVVNAIGVLPNVIAAIATGIELGGAVAGVDDDGGIGAAACPGGGTATRTGTIVPGFNLNVQLMTCRVPTVDGFVTFDGSIVQSGGAINVNVTAQFEDAIGMPTVTVDAMFTATVSGIPSLGGPCRITSLTITIANGGTITTTTASGQSASATFQNTSVTVSNLVSGSTSSCVLVSYRLTFNGNAALVAADAEPIQVTFNMLRMDVDDSGDPALFTLSGGITSSCFGGAVTVSTEQSLAVLDGELCPRAGAITAGTSRIFYRSNQNVEIDADGDGSVDPPTYPDCLDPRLYECLA